MTEGNPALSMVRKPISCAAERKSTTVLQNSMQDGVLVCAAPVGERAIGTGVLTIDDIRNGDPAACTLLLAAGSPGTADDAHRRRPRP